MRHRRERHRLPMKLIWLGAGVLIAIGASSVVTIKATIESAISTAMEASTVKSLEV